MRLKIGATTIWDSSSGEDRVEGDFAHILQDMRSGSITPTTFAERAFEDTTDNLWFTDKYRCNGSEVMRFGINGASSQIISSITGDRINMLDSASRAASTVKSTGYKLENVKEVQLASLETRLLNEAISHLINFESRAVLVDILARVNGGSTNGYIKVTDSGSPEIHTVVLYKNPTINVASQADVTTAASSSAAATILSAHPVEILVIDPSNFLFSSHLSNFNAQRGRAVETASASIASDADLGDFASSTSAIITDVTAAQFIIKTIHKGLQIYKPAGEIGPRQDEYRDCIDLAAKIAFGLNQMENWPVLLEAQQVESCVVIQNVSNSKSIDISIIDPKLPVRVKQNSDLTIRENFNKLEKLVSVNHEVMFKILPETDYRLFKLQCSELLNKATSGTVVQELSLHNEVCLSQIHRFCDTLSAAHAELVGELNLIDLGEL